MAEGIKIFGKNGELIRVYSEAESDENGDYKEKAKMFAEKNGYSIGKAPKVEEAEEPEALGTEEVEKPAAKPKKKK